MPLLRHELLKILFPPRYTPLKINFTENSALGKHFMYYDVANYTT